MRNTQRSETALLSQIPNWAVVPLLDDDAPLVEFSGRRIPQRFGGWWREMTEAADPLDRVPTGREVELRLAVRGGRVVINEVTFRRFDDEFDRQGVPALRDYITSMFLELDGGDVMEVGGAWRAAGQGGRDSAVREVKRRRRRNAVDLDDIARLDREGGAKRIAEEYDVHPATAYRWRNQAKAAGLIDGKR